MLSHLKNAFCHLARRSIEQGPGAACFGRVAIRPSFLRASVVFARFPLGDLLDFNPLLQGQLCKSSAVDVKLRAQLFKGFGLTHNLRHEIGAVASTGWRNESSQHNGCNGYRSTHKPLPPMTSHLGTFEGERKRNSRGFDEDCSLTRALLALLAIAVFLYAISLFTRIN